MRSFGKALAVAAMVAALAFGLVACGGSNKSSGPDASSSGTSSTASSKAAELADRAGFDDQTNQSITLCGVNFSVPSYYSESDNAKEEVSIYQALTPDGDEDLAILMTYSSQGKAASTEKFESNKQDVVLSALKSNKILADVEISGVSQEQIAGLPSGVYELSGKCVNDSGSRDFTGKGCIFLNPSMDYGVVYFIQVDGAKSDYAPDFDRVIASAVVNEQVTEDSSAVSADVKEALDSYEAFVDEYIAFMQKYKESSDVTSMLADYSTYMQKCSDLSAKIEAMDTDNMSAADYAYYIDVTTRCSQKLLNASV